MPYTLYDKIWNHHIVSQIDDGYSLIYIDRHLVHEVTSPQAFEGLKVQNRPIWRKETILSVPDHNVPTKDRHLPNPDPSSVQQLNALEENVKHFDLAYFPMDDDRQGIVHVIGPEQGFTLPGTTLVCGDSHTSTHGALGSLAFGIGTSEIEHCLATQTLVLKKSKNMRITFDGVLPLGCSAKDMALAMIKKIGTAGGTGSVIEFSGSMVKDLSIEERMTLCNMSIEAGARAGMVAPDEKTYEYLKGKPYAPKGAIWDQAVAYWQNLISDDDALFDHEITITENDVAPMVTWGTSPEDVVSVAEHVPTYEELTHKNTPEAYDKSLNYMGLKAGQPISSIPIDRCFVGSCTNSRLEDLRRAAAIAKGKKVASTLKEAIIVPGSGLVKYLAEQEGLDQIFLNAGFEWRDAGCSMCLGMNPDKADFGDHVASTSNRNFIGRQGKGARTHLMSPEMAVAAAIAGHIVDVRTF